MTSENDRRIRVMRDDSIDPVNADMFDMFVEGFQQGVVAMLEGADLSEYVMYIQAGDRDWKEYDISVMHVPSSHQVAQFHFSAKDSYERLVEQFTEQGYTEEEAAELVMVTMGVGTDTVRDRVKAKTARAAAMQVAGVLEIPDPDELEDNLLDRQGGFKPDKGEA